MSKVNLFLNMNFKKVFIYFSFYTIFYQFLRLLYIIKYLCTMKNILLLLLPILILSSCKKDQLLTDSGAKLDFSTDSVLFDTVFTQVGSTTKLFRIYNNHTQPMNISNIHLAGGSSSQFRLNVDGVNGTSIKDVEILGGDSLYAFVQVTVNPNEPGAHVILEDEVIFETNGNVQSVYLTAIGRNVYLHKPDHFPLNGLPPYSIICNNSKDAVWKSDKPHLIFGFAVVDSACTLTMTPGTQVYFHKNAVLWVYAYGSLKVMGSHDERITFEGDRLEPEYKEIPGQWGYIWLMNGSINNKIDWAIIKNGAIGLKVGDNTDYPHRPSLTLTNTIIKNQKAAAIYALDAHIYSYNCVFANCGQYVAALTFGGAYNFQQCTFANYWDHNTNNGTGSATTTARTNPSVVLTNSYTDATGNTTLADLDTANFINSIISGDIDEELAFDNNTALPTNFNFMFDHCLLKTTLSTGSASHYSNILQNTNPSFKDENNNDYNLNTTSLAKDSGNSLFYISKDLNDKFRNFGAPDLGAYEIQQ